MTRSNADQRPKNREVEDEMIRPPAKEDAPPRPATDPTGSAAEVANHGTEPAKSGVNGPGVNKPAVKEPAVKGTKFAPGR